MILFVAPPRPTVALDRPIRSTRRIGFVVACAWLFAVAMLAIGAPAVVKWGSQEGVGSALADTAFFGGIAAAAIWYGVRVRRAELRISSRSVIVRNPIRCHTVPLDAVKAFGPGNATPHGNNGTAGIVVCLSGGHVLPVWALADEGTVFSMKKKTLAFAPLAGELNVLLASARESTEDS
jgi:hypothetical protein